MEKINSLDLSEEILFEKFRHFSNGDLLVAAQFCERFKSIAKKVVVDRFNGDSEDKYYDVCVSVNEKVYRRFIEMFGNEIVALKLVSRKGTNKKLLQLISQHCRSTKYVNIESVKDSLPITKIIRSMSNLNRLTLTNLKSSDLYWADKYFPELKTLCLDTVTDVNVQVLKQFLIINPQLRHLKIADCPRFPLNVLQPLRNHLNRLTSLEYTTPKCEFTNKSININAENLESLKVSTDYSSAANVLSAFNRGSKMIRNLEVIMQGEESDADQTLGELSDTIATFEKLNSLKLFSFDMSIELFEIYAKKLPKLATIHANGVWFKEILTDDILHVFEIFNELCELKLESETCCISFPQRRQVDFFINSINLEFYNKLVALGRQRGNKIKLELIQPNEKVLITEEKIVQNGELRYWSGYDASLSRSDVHLFDLNDQAMDKIFNYLDESSQHALYQTCNKMKNALQERIKSQWFTVSDEKTTKDLFNRFGEHITKLSIDMKTDDSLQMVDTWKLISDNYSKQITEISMKNVRVDATGNVPVEFPNLSKLNVHSIVPSSAYIFPLMNCPKLAQLEFYSNSTSSSEEKSDYPSKFGISLNNLSVIRLTKFNENTERILNRLDDETCNRLEEFTVEQMEKYQMVKVVNVAMRCRNLTTLNLANTGTAATNYEYLFQNCTKLKKLTLFDDFCYDSHNSERILQVIKENCKQLEVVQLIRRWICYWSTMLTVRSVLSNVKVKRYLYDEDRKIYKLDDYTYMLKCPI